MDEKKERIITRNKPVGIILSILLGSWCWLYTYKFDAWKFWLSWGLLIPCLFLGAIGIISIIIIEVCTWIWAILDMIFKDQDKFDNYGLY